MPELPEVEAPVQFLAERAVGRVVARVDVLALNVLKTFDPPPTALQGLAVTGVGQVIAGTYGSLTITSISSGAVGYSYTLADNTNGDAKLALSNGEIDALVADLPTAFSVANELRDGLMVGQLPTAAGDVEQFGIVLDKGSALTRCVSSAVDALRDGGTLAALQDKWLAGAGKAPVLG